MNTLSGSKKTILAEDTLMPAFAKKDPLSIERGEGLYVWDEEGNKYLDFTAGWGVTCIGHASPVIAAALAEQDGKIIQNPNSGATYSPSRARLLDLLSGILPPGLSRVFFSNSGAEANDAAIKLARKASGKRGVVSALMSFHGRTIGTVSATGQADHRDIFSPLVPDFKFVPYDDLEAMEEAVSKATAAVILEPIQGEGGVIVPSPGYLEGVSEICRRKGAYLIVDEVQTGFFRTGPAFAISRLGMKADILTMAKGLAGGFPFAAFAMSEEIAGKLEAGDHGGTYCGNPLGCAVSYAVVNYLLENDIENRVEKMGAYLSSALEELRRNHPSLIACVRGSGLLLAVEFREASFAERVCETCLREGLILNLKHGKVLRIFPALTISRGEADEGLRILREAVASKLP